MSPDERHYYIERSAIERRRAAESSNPHVVEIHEKLAALYDKLVDTEDFPAPALGAMSMSSSSRA